MSEKQNKEEKAKLNVNVSELAFRRLLALRKAERLAAIRIKTGDDYPDFFVEGGGDPWHERWPEVVNAGRHFSDSRMLFVDRLNQEDYPDFFVEGGGDPWHERWPEVVSGMSLDRIRTQAMKGLNVMQAYLDIIARES